MHFTTRRFWQCYDSLPEPIQEVADENYELNQLASGELVTIEVGKERSPQETDPWLKHLGIFASDPTFDDFLGEVAADRQQVDEQEVFE